MVSTSMLLINKVSFTLEASGNDHTLAGIRTLFRFYNSAGNAVRYFCVANVPKDLGKQDPTCLDGLKLLETVDGMLAAQMVAREHQGTFLLSLIILQLCNPEPQMSALWQYGLWSFQTGGTKLERFLPKNQHNQRKLLNFENWVYGDVSKSAKI